MQFMSGKSEDLDKPTPTSPTKEKDKAVPVVSGNSEMKPNEAKMTHENEDMLPTLSTTQDI